MGSLGFYYDGLRRKKPFLTLELLVSKAKDINTSAHAGINVDLIIRSGIERFPAALSAIQ